jgi:hypothetical protein
MTLAVSLVLTASLGALIYFAATSLPFLAVSPTSDPTFGRQNECLLRALANRVGFAVSRDAATVAAFSPGELVVCGPDGVAQHLSLAGVTEAAFDGAGRLWVTAQPGDGGSSSLMVKLPGRGAAFQPVGDVAPLHLVGVDDGVVALERSGRLVAVRGDGSVGGVVDLPALERAVLSASGDAQRVAVVAGGGFWVFEAAELKKVRGEAPCSVEYLWWLLEKPDSGSARHRAVLECGGASSWALSMDVDLGAQETAAVPPARAVLAGPLGPWVQPCEVLPCTAVSP